MKYSLKKLQWLSYRPRVLYHILSIPDCIALCYYCYTVWDTFNMVSNLIHLIESVVSSLSRAELPLITSNWDCFWYGFVFWQSKELGLDLNSTTSMGHSGYKVEKLMLSTLFRLQFHYLSICLPPCNSDSSDNIVGPDNTLQRTPPIT